MAKDRNLGQDKSQQGLDEDRSDRESGQPLQLDDEKKLQLDDEKKMNEKQGGQHAQGEKQHQGGQGGQQPRQGGQQPGGNR